MARPEGVPDLGNGCDVPNEWTFGGRLSNPVQRRFAPADVEALTSQYRAGAALVELADRFDPHRSTIAAHVDRKGSPQRQPRVRDKEGLAEAGHPFSSGRIRDRCPQRNPPIAYKCSHRAR